ncbi:peptide chain release factor 1 [Candidatus Saccharibacteria bacterium]|nr:peptide chain release factor 1 [Candidatus Saccharibacteria bacterium]
MEAKLKTYREELNSLESKLQDPGIFSTPGFPKLAKRINELQDLISLFDGLTHIQEQELEAQEMIEAGGELGEMAIDELEELRVKKLAAEQALSLALTPKDPNDERNAIFEIRAAAGGDESSLFAAELYRMYIRFCETHNYKYELITESPSEAGGFKEISFLVKGEEAYGKFKFEAGVHRVQRVPVTESQGRIHTSTVTVAVLPEAEENDIEIKPSDLRIDVYHASGHGGQSVNTTDSAVRITHLPTGLVVTQQDEKSQIKNKAKAMGVLRSRLLQAKIEEEQKTMSDARNKLIGSGDRSEKIRTYNFPQDRITDHRITYSRSNIPAALAGQIDDLIEELHKAEHELLSNEA